MDELKNQFTELSKLKNEVPFRVPKNYFDDFSARLINRIEAEKIAVPKSQNRIIQFLKPALGLAASFALIFMLVYWPLKTFNPQQEAENASETEISDMDYVNIVEGIDENSFYALLSEPAQKAEISDDELINYLSSNISDYDVYVGTEY